MKDEDTAEHDCAEVALATLPRDRWGDLLPKVCLVSGWNFAQGGRTN